MSIPKEPRQMMINMMYLVLTALLALNVSAEILNAFHVVNDGINNSNVAVDTKNDRTMKAFEKQMQNDPLKTGPFYQKAQQVQQSSEQLYKYIQSLKDIIVNKSGGWVDKNGVKHKNETDWTEDKGQLDDDKNLEVSTNLMVENKRGDTLQQKIQALRTTLLGIVNDVKPAAEPEYEVQLPLKIEKPKPNSDGEIKPWTASYFEMVPTIAAVTILNKFQNDVRTSESQMLDFLFKQINANDIPVDRIKAEVIAPTSYVMDGQQYKSDIFVAAYSSTQNPTIVVGQLNPAIAKKDANGDYPSDLTENPLIGNGTTVNVEDGMGKYTTTASGQGDQHYSGVVEVKGGNGQVKYYPFDAEYTTAAAAVVVSPDKMNVFYIGVDNPVSISVPGFGNDKISANMSNGGTITGGKGKYIVRVTPDGISKGTDVAVSAQQLDKTNKVMGAVHFRVKRIPDPSPEVGNLFPGPTPVSTFKAQQIVIASLANFDFDVKFPVISFDLTYAAKRQDLLTDSQTGGAIFTAKMQNFMKAAKPGDVFYLDNIKAKAPDGTVRKLPSIIYKMM